jgi:ABC-type phosphate transport system permease subunit
MKPTLSTLAAVVVFKFVFRASWKVSLLAGAATLAVLTLPPLVWERKEEKL